MPESLIPKVGHTYRIRMPHHLLDGCKVNYTERDGKRFFALAEDRRRWKRDEPIYLNSYEVAPLSYEVIS